MAPRRKKVDPNDVVIDVDVPPLEDAGSAVAVVDEVAKAVAALEEQAKSVAIDARKQDMERVCVIDEVLNEIGESLKRTKWDEVAVKEKAIAFGILTDKKGKILDDIVPERKERRKRAKRQNIFIYEISNKDTRGVAVAIEEGGDDE
jgi:hypothetical protein